MKITRRDEEATGSEGAAKWGRWKPRTQEVGLWSSCTKQRVVAALREWGLVTALGLQLMLQLKKHDKHTENLCSRGRNEPQATQVLWSQHDKLSTTLATYENKIPSFLSGSPPPSFIKAGGYGVWEVSSVNRRSGSPSLDGSLKQTSGKLPTGFLARLKYCSNPCSC